MANNNITLKINSAKETLETIHLKSGTVTAIAAQNKVNYQFIDEKTGVCARKHYDQTRW